jgi:hypothetical protein
MVAVAIEMMHEIRRRLEAIRQALATMRKNNSGMKSP